MANSSGLCDNIFLVFTWRHATTRSFWTCQVSSNMAAPYKTLFNFENQKLASWLIWPSCIHFWSQKSGVCYLRGFCGHVTSWWKPSIRELILWLCPQFIEFLSTSLIVRKSRGFPSEVVSCSINQFYLFIHGIIHQFFIKIVKTYIL